MINRGIVSSKQRKSRFLKIIAVINAAFTLIEVMLSLLPLQLFLVIDELLKAFPNFDLLLNPLSFDITFEYIFFILRMTVDWLKV